MDPIGPIAVEYEITPPGRPLQPPFKTLYSWMLAHMADVENARDFFDARAAVA